MRERCAPEPYACVGPVLRRSPLSRDTPPEEVNLCMAIIMGISGQTGAALDEEIALACTMHAKVVVEIEDVEVGGWRPLASSKEEEKPGDEWPRHGER